MVHTKLPHDTHFSTPLIFVFFLFFFLPLFNKCHLLFCLVTTTGITVSRGFLSFPYFFFTFYFYFLYFHLSFLQVEEEAVGSRLSGGPMRDKFAHPGKGDTEPLNRAADLSPLAKTCWWRHQMRNDQFLLLTSKSQFLLHEPLGPCLSFISLSWSNNTLCVISSIQTLVE